MRSNGTPGIDRRVGRLISLISPGVPLPLARTLIVAALFVFLVACSAEDDAWARIEQSGVLRVGLDPTFPPFENDDGQGLHGLDVDLARALAAELGLQAEFVYFGYDGLYDALAADKVDVLMSALVIVPERTRDFAYSDSYFDAGDILIMAADGRSLETMEDLAGHTLAVELGAQGHVEATVWSQRLAGLVVRPYDSSAEAMAAVAAQEADAALVDSVSARLYLVTRPELRRSAQPVTSEPFAAVVRANDPILLARINDNLHRLRESGELERIVSTWLGR